MALPSHTISLPSRSVFDDRFVMRVDMAKLTKGFYPARLAKNRVKEITFRLAMWKGGPNYDVDAEDVFAD